MNHTGRHRGFRLAAVGRTLLEFACGVALAGAVVMVAVVFDELAASPPGRRAVAPKPALEQGRLGARVPPGMPFPGRDASGAPPAAPRGSLVAQLDRAPGNHQEARAVVGSTPTEAATPSAFVRAIVTAYDHSAVSCGRWAAVPIARRRTACGASLLERLTQWQPFVAGPPELPAGTLIRIPGYAAGRPVPVLDRGGAFTGGLPVLRLDVFIPDVGACLHWGRREVEVEILNWPAVKPALSDTEGTE